MITGHREKMLVVESPFRLNGWIIGFANGSGTWFYTPEEPPEGIENEVVADMFDKKSHNFPTKEEAEAFGIGFEKEVERKL